ncbi:MAG: ABC transporter substrate-binding protein [Oribacterium sp.]|nr:ABC transporter substrate-binding protein [Oribacterium sp.]
MKKKLLVLLVAFAMVAALALTGCGGTGSTDPSDNGEGGENHLNMALYWFGDDLDPGNGWNGWTLTRAAVGETLVTVTEDLEFVGQLADSWEAVDDTTWKFHIRPNVTFQNGNPVTPEAVVSSIQRSLDVNERGQTNLKLKSVEADGEYVVFVTEEPYGAFLANLTEPLFIIVDTTADTSTFGDTPVCTGPYMVTSHEPGVSFEAVAYKDYWAGTPGFDSITVYNVDDDNSRSMGLQGTDYDMIQRVAATDLQFFEDSDKYEVQISDGSRVQFLFMNNQSGPFADENIRLAFNSAVNYDAIAQVLGGGVNGLGSPFPPAAPFYKELNCTTYDPAKCAEYLKAAGYEDTDGDGYVDKDGEPLTVTITMASGSNTTVSSTTIAELVQKQVGECGIKFEIKQAENVSDLQANGEFDMTFANWQTLSTGDPQWFLDQVFKTGATDNYAGYSNSDLDALVDSMSTTFDVNERMNIARDASQIIIDHGFGCFLVDVTNINVCRSTIKNMHTFPIDYYMLTYDTTYAE